MPNLWHHSLSQAKRYPMCCVRSPCTAVAICVGGMSPLHRAKIWKFRGPMSVEFAPGDVGVVPQDTRMDPWR